MNEFIRKNQKSLILTISLQFVALSAVPLLLISFPLSAYAEESAVERIDEAPVGPEDESVLENEMNELNSAIQGLRDEFHDSDHAPTTSLSQIGRERRLDHARELLGKYYKKSVVRGGEQVKKINGMIYRWTRKQLPKAFKKDYKKIAQAIIDQSLKHEFDPVFLLAVISNESKFDPTIIGSFGEIGLMQIRPKTAKWIAEIKGLKYKGKKSLHDPITNIKIGSAFLAYLREKFDSHARLYLAAYNMGQGNVKYALSKKIWPKDYASLVMHHYVGYYNELVTAD